MLRADLPTLLNCQEGLHLPFPSPTFPLSDPFPSFAYPLPQIQLGDLHGERCKLPVGSRQSLAAKCILV